MPDGVYADVSVRVQLSSGQEMIGVVSFYGVGMVLTYLFYVVLPFAVLVGLLIAVALEQEKGLCQHQFEFRRAYSLTRHHVVKVCAKCNKKEYLS